MGTLTEEITRIKAAKVALETAIESKEVSIPDGALIDTYAGAVEQIEVGGGVDVSGSTVTADKMLEGVKAVNADGELITGTIPSQAAKTYTPGTSNQTIAAGKYLSGKQTIKGDANLKAENIKSGVTIFNVTGSYEGESSGGGTFAKVTEFIAPYDAFSAVSAIQVSGFGMAETWDGETDFSDWNGTYEVTDKTFIESDINKRVFKHSTQEKYLYYIYDYDWGEEKWIFDTAEDETYISGSNFYSSNLASGSWYNYDYEFSVSLTIKQVSTNYPAQPLVLKAVTASYDNGAWSFGTAETDFTEYEENPKVGYVYATTGTELIGNPISRDILYIGDELVLSIPFASETMVAETGQQLQYNGNDCTYTTLDGVPCINIDGGYFYTAENSGFVGNMNRTFSFWAFPTTEDSYVNAVGCGKSQSTGRMFNCGACAEGDFINATFTTWGNDIYFNTVKQDDKLHHFVYIYNDSTPDILTIFVDGVKYVERLDASIDTEESPFYLGRSGGGGWWYRGYLAKVRCYKTVLTDKEVKKLFNDKK